MSLILAMAHADRRASRPRSRSHVTRLQRVALGAIAFGVIAVPAVAYAEGGFSSTLQSVSDGFQTRRWTDRNNDSASTLTGANQCSKETAAAFNMSVELRRDQPGFDKGYGSKNFAACVSGNWVILEPATSSTRSTPTASTGSARTRSTSDTDANSPTRVVGCLRRRPDGCW